MKVLLLALFFIQALGFRLNAQQPPHLILHFDINKTLIASDLTENKSVEDVVNELLSKKHLHLWDESLLEPITFEAYVKAVILPGAEHDVHLKEKRLKVIIHFIDYLRDFHPSLHETVLKEFNLVLNSLKKNRGKVFPSFYRLILELNANKIPYSLYLRSFGKEIFEVKNEINEVFENLFKWNGKFQKGILYIDEKEYLSESDRIYNFFSTNDNAAIQDDWKYWMENEMRTEFGKPLYIDQKDKNTLTLFFDDNIKMQSNDKNIISPIDANTGEFISITKLIESKQAVSVNTLEAILNECYYIERVQEALEKNSEFTFSKYQTLPEVTVLILGLF